MGYILVFLVCHSPRLMLNIYELFTIRQAMECQTVGLDAFPLWPQVKLAALVNPLKSDWESSQNIWHKLIKTSNLAPGLVFLINQIPPLASRFIYNHEFTIMLLLLLLQVFTAFSHLFLVLNSSINILIYSLLSSRFRDEVIKGVRRIRGCRNSALWSPPPSRQQYKSSSFYGHKFVKALKRESLKALC